VRQQLHEQRPATPAVGGSDGGVAEEGVAAGGVAADAVGAESPTSGTSTLRARIPAIAEDWDVPPALEIAVAGEGVSIGELHEAYASLERLHTRELGVVRKAWQGRCEALSRTVRELRESLVMSEREREAAEAREAAQAGRLPEQLAEAAEGARREEAARAAKMVDGALCAEMTRSSIANALRQVCEREHTALVEQLNISTLHESIGALSAACEKLGAQNEELAAAAEAAEGAKAASRSQVEEALATLQVQNEALQVQNEALQVENEDLRRRTRVKSEKMDTLRTQLAEAYRTAGHTPSPLALS